VKIAERPLKFLGVGLAGRGEERLDEIDEVGMRERFFEKMNRAQTGGPLAMRGQVNARQNDGARIRMARAQIVKEILAEIGNGIHVEDKKVRAVVHDEELGLFQIAGQIDLGGRGGFPERRENFRGEVLVGFEHKNAPALFGKIFRMSRGHVV